MQQAMKVDQRAWVGQSEIIPKEPDLFGIKGDSKHPVTVPLMNFGKTPALEVINDLNGGVFDKNHVLALGDISYHHTYPSRYEAVIYPAQKRVQLGDIEFVGDDTGAEIRSGAKIAYVWGFATYKDVFGARHRTEWCYFWRENYHLFDSCSIYNNAN